MKEIVSIEELSRILNLDKNNIKIKEFKNGTMSKVFLINEKYILKSNNQTQLKCEVEFLKSCKNQLFSKLIYVDSAFKFIIYLYIEGNDMKNVYNPKEVITKLYEVVSTYSSATKLGYGYADEIMDTWDSFINNEIIHSSLDLTNRYNINKAKNAKGILKKYTFVKKILHGDFGTHNFIENDSKFVGIIDPQTVYGDYLYDFLFAIVSNVDLIKSITIDEIVNLVKEDKEKVKAMYTVVLYSRISRCLKYHKEDIDIYNKYWDAL